MFLKAPKTSTDARVRSLLQKAARRGYAQITDRATTFLVHKGDKAWLRSRAVVITFEECWPLAETLKLGREVSSKRAALISVTNATKQKDAAGLGALAYALQEGDQSMLDCVPDQALIKIVSKALRRPGAFFEWLLTGNRSHRITDVIASAKQYLPAATWPWDKACILAGALLATAGELPTIGATQAPSKEFPYWVALDKHTPEGKDALAQVAKDVGTTYRKLIWASFYCESANVDTLLPSRWWNAERAWRLRRAGLSLNAAEDLWFRARPLLCNRLEREALLLKRQLEATDMKDDMPAQESFL